MYTGRVKWRLAQHLAHFLKLFWRPLCHLQRCNSSPAPSPYRLHVVTTDIYLQISGFSSARGILCACVFLVRKRSSFCLYSYLLADMDIRILCSILLMIVHATHPAPTRRGTHHYTLHASRFMCGCTVCNSLINFLHCFRYIVRSDG